MSVDNYANKLILAVLVTWLFLVRMYYQEKAVRPHSPRPAVPWWEHAAVTLTSLWLLPAFFYTFTGLMDPFQVPIPDGLRKLGAVLQTLGVLLYWWGHAALGPNWSAYLEIKPRHILVTGGPYRWVRHPMYLALFLFGTGMFLLSASWILALVYFTPILALYFGRVRAEEELLLAHFGDEYRAYQARTGRLLPRLKR